MKFSTAFSVIASLMLVSIVDAVINPSFSRTTFFGEPPESFDSSKPFQFGSTVDISADGTRMVVGADRGGGIFAYERTLLPTDFPVWDLVWELSGKDGEMIGDRLSLSADGRYVAVRRYAQSLDGDVEVYQIASDDSSGSMVGGGTIDVCGGSAKGKFVKLIQTNGNSDSDSNSLFAVPTTWLFASCESFDNNRGQVAIFRYDDATSDFTSFATIDGFNKGDMFGWALDAIVSSDQQFLQVAVSSPNANSRSGTIETFNCNQFGICTQFGDAITGDEDGEQLGFSLKMSVSAGKPFILAGSPRNTGGGTARGSASVHEWSDGDGVWEKIAQLNGSESNDRLGRAVAISGNGRFLAVSSIHHDRQTGMVILYERDPIVGSITLHSDITGVDHLSQWGSSVSIDETGESLLVGAPRSKNFSGSSVGTVQLLDIAPLTWDSPPLGSLPPKGKDSSTSDDSGIDFSDPSTYTPSSDLSDTSTNVPDDWPITESPASNHPSSAPSAEVSVQPSFVDDGPILSEESETLAPSSFPSTGPSESPSNFPSAGPSDITKTSTSSSAPQRLMQIFAAVSAIAAFGAMMV